MPNDGDVDEHRAADDQPQRFAHRRDVGGDIERVGDEQESNQDVKQHGGHRLHEIVPQARAR